MYRRYLGRICRGRVQRAFRSLLSCLWNALSDSVFLVIWLFTLQCPAVPGQFVAADITKMGKVCELHICDNMMKVKRKVICI